ncbi:MmyB family transcriptional regulator [Mangrovihabitans endophyticus]|uniref:Transcriptional regulator n=1 Tax=Mangrovihabitans endophyticus TaxID=1751298 RepID=A0A8J3C4I5_9ACTN|nr:transcriptional regulator [Mangrovihabitans endophyticus]GGL08872.1 transcriptional regulator [Mangrovihabitans endophyticus]
MYYLRLEQGRDLNPSDQILTALAGALQLDDDAIAYLHRLAHPTPRPKRRRTRTTAADVLQPLLDTWHHTPAYTQDATGQVTAANRLAVALCPFFTVGQIPLRAVFLEPEMRRLYRDWNDITAKAVSSLRTMLTGDTAEPELLELIGELSLASDRFRTLWARREIRGRTSGITRFAHPLAGPLELYYEKFLQPEYRQLLVVYRAPTPDRKPRNDSRCSPACSPRGHHRSTPVSPRQLGGRSVYVIMERSGAPAGDTSVVDRGSHRRRTLNNSPRQCPLSDCQG